MERRFNCVAKVKKQFLRTGGGRKKRWDKIVSLGKKTAWRLIVGIEFKNLKDLFLLKNSVSLSNFKQNAKNFMLFLRNSENWLASPKVDFLNTICQPNHANTKKCSFIHSSLIRVPGFKSFKNHF